tara:strand:+ start:1007 stop:1279 length:273 start_codon:yes stop_codon:yes gene_type:complete
MDKLNEQPAVSNPLEHVVMLQGVEALEDLLKVQCSDGNWDYDEYMHGMANGMILALSLFKAGEVKFLEAPDVWGKDSPCGGSPVSLSIAT